MIGICARREPLNECHFARARARGIEAVEAHRELTGREVEVLYDVRMERIAVTRRRERDHATIGRRRVRCARVRLAMREPDSEHQADGEGSVPQNAMHPWAMTTSKQILPLSGFRSFRGENDANW